MPPQDATATAEQQEQEQEFIPRNQGEMIYQQLVSDPTWEDTGASRDDLDDILDIETPEQDDSVGDEATDDADGEETTETAEVEDAEGDTEPTEAKSSANEPTPEQLAREELAAAKARYEELQRQVKEQSERKPDDAQTQTAEQRAREQHLTSIAQKSPEDLARFVVKRVENPDGTVETQLDPEAFRDTLVAYAYGVNQVYFEQQMRGALGDNWREALKRVPSLADLDEGSLDFVKTRGAVSKAAKAIAEHAPDKSDKAKADTARALEELFNERPDLFEETREMPPRAAFKYIAALYQASAKTQTSTKADSASDSGDSDAAARAHGHRRAPSASATKKTTKPERDFQDDILEL